MTTITDPLLLAHARRAAMSGKGAAIRRAARLSQAEVAASVGVTPSAVAHWEAGSRRPTGKAAGRYAELLAALSKVVSGDEARAIP